MHSYISSATINLSFRFLIGPTSTNLRHLENSMPSWEWNVVDQAVAGLENLAMQ